MKQPFFLYLHFCILFSLVSLVFANPTISLLENQINNGETYVGKLLVGNINQYSVDFTNKLNINQLKVDITFDTNKNIIPCVTAYPHLSLLNNNQNNCDQTSYENGKHSIVIENPQLSHWYIQITGVGNELEELIEYSLTASWEECQRNWGNSCEIEVQEVSVNTEETITFSNEQKIISFEVTEDLQEISILFWDESAANLCAFYQFSSPMTDITNAPNSICFENSQKLANFILSPAPIGKHFITFTEQPTASPSSFSLLISSSVCRRGICNENHIESIKEEVNDFPVSHNNDHFATSFLVQEKNQIFTFNLFLEDYKNEEILFTLAPRSLVGLEEFNHVLSVSNDDSITFQLIDPVPGEWMIFGEFISAPSARISMSINIDSINQAESIIPIEIYTTNHYSIDVPPRSWIYYQIIQQNKVSLAVNWELNDSGMILATQYDSLPSFTNFMKINQSNIIQIITKYDKTEYIGIYNPNIERKNIEISSNSINAVKFAKQQEKKVDNFLGEPNGANFEKGADTRVYIFIWSTVIICGGILIVCLIVLIIWTRKSFIKLKASGAYDALRGKEGQ